MVIVFDISFYQINTGCDFQESGKDHYLSSHFLNSCTFSLATIRSIS